MAAAAGVIARRCQSVVHVQSGTSAHNLSLRHLNQRRMDGSASSTNSGLRRQIGHVFEGGDVLRPAIRVSRVVEGVDADEYVLRSDGFGVCECEREKDSVA